MIERTNSINEIYLGLLSFWMSFWKKGIHDFVIHDLQNCCYFILSSSLNSDLKNKTNLFIYQPEQAALMYFNSISLIAFCTEYIFEL